MPEAGSLRALLRDHVRDRLTAAVGQVLTAALGQVLGQVLVQVLQELERALEDFEADSGGPEEPLKNTGVQFPEPKVKQEPQQGSCTVPASQPLESPQVKQEPTDRGRCLSESVSACESPAAADVDDRNQIQISLVTSLKDENTCKARPLGPEQVPDQNLDLGREEKRFEQPQSDSGGRQNLHENEKAESKPAERRNDDKNPHNKFALKVPLIKLYPLFPKTDSKNEKIVPKNITVPAKSINQATWARKQKEERFMCMCLKLFTKEDLKTHQTPKEGEDRPFGCPSVPQRPVEIGPGGKRSYGQAFNVKGSREEQGTAGFQNKAGRTDDESSGEEGNLRIYRETLSKAKTPEKREEENEAGPNNEEQAGAALDSDHSDDSDDSSESDDSSDSGDMAVAEAGDAGEAAVREAGILFPCDVCGRGFSWLPDLYRHRRQHFSKPLWCSDCGRTFRRVTDLRNHLCIQTQRPYSCSVCSEAFFLHIQLQNHMRQHRAAQRR